MRVGINISDGLYRRLKTVDVPLNLSQVCRDAIEAIVVEHEELANRIDDDLSDIIEEFTTTTDTEWDDIDWRAYAWDDARAALREMDRETLERVLYYREVTSKTLSPEELRERLKGDYLRGCFPRYDERIKQHRDLLDKEEERLDSRDLEHISPWWNSRVEYEAAWFRYVEAFIRRIEQKRRASEKERAVTRRQDRATMPEPEVPDHLV